MAWPSVTPMYFVRDLVSPRTWLAFIHHFIGVCVGAVVVWIVVPGLVVGAMGLPVAMIGMPILGTTLRFTDWFARTERARFAVTLGEQIPAWPAGTRSGYRFRLLPRFAKLSERATWREVGYAVLRGPLSAAAAFVTLSVWAIGLILVTLPLYDWSLPGGGFHAVGLTLHEPKAVVTALAGLLVLLAAPQVTRGLAAVDAALTRSLLGPPSSLAARVAELELSRDRVVDAAEAERKRIERDLHDGAQQRLVALAMELGRARARFSDDIDAARDLVDSAHAQAKAALTELRDLVRGVHPPVLTDRGLDAALSGLAARCPVPVDVSVEMQVRPKPLVEAVAYFVVAEALTNVAKHSRASQAKVVVEGHGYPGTLTIMISDDGIGGADPQGAGLSGLAGRVSGVDGRLTVESPYGGPTIIAAELPCSG
jgi:signal transduction histidine kinase